MRRIVQDARVNASTLALVHVSAALGTGDAQHVRGALQHAATACTQQEIEETLLQSYLFLGYPAALNALALWRQVSGTSGERGEDADASTWRSRGERVCAQVYAGQYPRLRSNIARLHPEVEEWMLTEGYGKVLGRPGLDLRARELCIVALLIGQDAAPQLHAHLRGALNVGADVADVEVAVAAACELANAARRASARATWQSVKERWLTRAPQRG